MSGSSRKYTHKAEREGFTLTIKNPSEMEEQDWADIEGMLDKSGEYKNFDTGSGEKRRDLGQRIRRLLQARQSPQCGWTAGFTAATGT